MKELRKNEFKDLLEMHELLFKDMGTFIRADIPKLGEITYYAKSNRLQISKGNQWKDDGFYFVKNHLNNL